MTFVHSTNVYTWKERLFGKPGFKPSRLSIYDNGKLLWEREESGKQKGWANLREIFPHIRIGILNNEMKKERASDGGFILAYHTLILPLDISKPTVQTGLQEREFAVAFEREIHDWMQAFARVSGNLDRFNEIVRKYRLRKKYNVYSGSSHYGLSQIGEKLDNDESSEIDGGDPARLWSAAHGASEDYVSIWSTFQEQAIQDLATSGGMSDRNGCACVKCWQT